MYSTCLHCQRDLGNNEAIESFPVSRRIAFDAAQGRLWAVCRHCERWNLAPFEERWEAVEQCERAYRDTRVRVATDNIGLAKLTEGTELVRIGKPLRPEFAAWRYGDQFGRRRVKSIAIVGGIGAAAGLGAFGLAAAGAGVVGFLGVLHTVNILAAAAIAGRGDKPMSNPNGQGYFRPWGRPRLMKRDDVPEGWGIEMGYTELLDNLEKKPFDFLNQRQNMAMGALQIRGDDATPILRRALPRVNSGGASRRTVLEAVKLIEAAGDPANFGKWAITQRSRWSARQTLGDSGDLQYIPAEARLAFEMAVFEEDERRALMGELAELERAWKEAEAIAKIADSLHVPERVEGKLRDLKRDK